MSAARRRLPPPPLVQPGEDAGEVVSRYAAELARRQGRFALQVGETEWLILDSLEVEWTLEDGTVIDVEFGEDC